jgi:hypothetical protein
MSVARVREVRSEPPKKQAYRPPLRVVHEDKSIRHAEAMDRMAKIALRRQRMTCGPGKYAV